MGRPALDLSGRRFGRLTVVRRAPGDADGYARWLCQCDCGGQTIVISQSLRRGATKSCGCGRRGPRPFSTPADGRTAAQKRQTKREWRAQKRAAVAAGKTLSPRENEAMSRVLALLERSPSTIPEVVAGLGCSRSSAQNYVSFLLMRRQIELACVRDDKSKVYRIAGSGAQAPRVDGEPERFDGAELAAALGLVAREPVVGGRVYLLDEREAA